MVGMGPCCGFRDPCAAIGASEKLDLPQAGPPPWTLLPSAGAVDETNLPG